MDVEKVFHMKGGVDDTSYAQNSSLQKKASDRVKHITLETLQGLYLATNPETLNIADLGCSSGPNTLSTIKDLIGAIEAITHKTQQSEPEFRIYLNDLPTNDFNSIFQALPEFYKALKREKSDGTPCVYIAGFPGSFYGRIFPNNYLHFVYSSYSLHWLSKVPKGLYDEQGKSINRGGIYIDEASPPQVVEAYVKQFQEDFSLFLRSRSLELVTGGRTVLILLGRRGPNHIDRGNSFFWKLLSRSFALLISQGKIEQEKLDTYEVHFYAPTKEEIEAEVRKEGSFELKRLEMFEVTKKDYEYNGWSYGTTVAMTVRAIQESMISHHFGENILDTLFDTYAKLIDEEMGRQEIRPITHVLVLKKMVTVQSGSDHIR